MNALLEAAEPMPTALCVPIRDGKAEVRLMLEPSSFVMMCC